MNILEHLYISYNQELVNMLWHKQLAARTNRLELRDDFSYWVQLLVNYWVSFNDSSDDTVSEIVTTMCSANVFFCHHLIVTLMANYFDEPDLFAINEK